MVLVLNKILKVKKLEPLKNVRQFNYDHWYKVEHERQRRIKYKKEEFFKDKSIFDLAKFVASQGALELKKYFNELKNSESNYKPILEHGEFDFLYKFNSQTDINNWMVSSDSGYKIGKTKASLQLTQQNTGLFSGYLSNDYDKPEKSKAIYTGYANISSIPEIKSFKREKRINIDQFNCFMLKIRGDGRTYMFILHTPQRYTLTYTYMHMYPLYTRGGPYWQYVKIPFSKFFHVTHGRVSDRQYRFEALNVKSLGITCMDGNDGPFSLEIDHIGVLKDNECTEDFAYETYKIPKYISNT